jgi:hypothetical protein
VVRIEVSKTIYRLTMYHTVVEALGMRRLKVKPAEVRAE